ncbi:hypothetical protein ACMYSQ_011658 [Aspergillus niger]
MASRGDNHGSQEPQPNGCGGEIKNLQATPADQPLELRNRSQSTVLLLLTPLRLVSSLEQGVFSAKQRTLAIVARKGVRHTPTGPQPGAASATMDALASNVAG